MFIKLDCTKQDAHHENSVRDRMEMRQNENFQVFQNEEKGQICERQTGKMKK